MKLSRIFRLERASCRLPPLSGSLPLSEAGCPESKGRSLFLYENCRRIYMSFQ